MKKCCQMCEQSGRDGYHDLLVVAGEAHDQVGVYLPHVGSRASWKLSEHQNSAVAARKTPPVILNAAKVGNRPYDTACAQRWKSRGYFMSKNVPAAQPLAVVSLQPSTDQFQTSDGTVCCFLDCRLCVPTSTAVTLLLLLCRFSCSQQTNTS